MRNTIRQFSMKKQKNYTNRECMKYYTSNPYTILKTQETRNAKITIPPPCIIIINKILRQNTPT